MLVSWSFRLASNNSREMPNAWARPLFPIRKILILSNNTLIWQPFGKKNYMNCYAGEQQIICFLQSNKKTLIRDINMEILVVKRHPKTFEGQPLWQRHKTCRIWKMMKMRVSKLISAHSRKSNVLKFNGCRRASQRNGQFLRDTKWRHVSREKCLLTHFVPLKIMQSKNSPYLVDINVNELFRSTHCVYI